MKRPASDPIGFYDAIAGKYDAVHRGWMALGGRMAVAAVKGCVAGAGNPRASVLDAGSGSGRVVRDLLPIAPRCAFTLLDSSPHMLELAADLPVTRIVGDLRRLPFASDSFDVVLSTWALETLATDREIALRELARVLKPGGTLVYSVCANPPAGPTRLFSTTLRAIDKHFFHGNFLTVREAVPADWSGTRVLTFHGGLSMVVIYRKGGAEE